MKAPSQPATGPSGRFCAAAAGIVLGYVALLVSLAARHEWLVAANGRPIPSDFLAYWSAGRAALAGKAATAYDPNVLHALQTSIAGYFPDYFYWSYPPPFLFVAVLLASLAFGVAYVSWIVAGAAAFSLTMAAIVRRRTAIFFALASPAALLTSYAGQNGFLTAALFGGFLVALRSRPVVSGILIGLMTYKPQFGILLPIALLANGQWRCFGSAILTASTLVVLSILVFGVGTSAQFLHALPVASNAVLKLGGEGWQKIQSVYGAARFLGGGDQLAWFVQGALILVCAASVALLWKGKAPFAVKAAGLVTCAMLSTPYLHIYDFPVLIIALAFLYADKPFDSVEWTVAAVANILIAGFVLQLAPLGLIAIVLVAAVTTRRLLVKSSPAVPVVMPLAADSAIA